MFTFYAGAFTARLLVSFALLRSDDNGRTRDKQPGWDRNSWGLHSDDGCFHHGGAIALPATADPTTFGPGDTVGCGLLYPRVRRCTTARELFLRQEAHTAATPRFLVLEYVEFRWLPYSPRDPSLVTQEFTRAGERPGLTFWCSPPQGLAHYEHWLSGGGGALPTAGENESGGNNGAVFFTKNGRYLGMASRRVNVKV